MSTKSVTKKQCVAKGDAWIKVGDRSYCRPKTKKEKTPKTTALGSLSIKL